MRKLGDHLAMILSNRSPHATCSLASLGASFTALSSAFDAVGPTSKQTPCMHTFLNTLWILAGFPPTPIKLQQCDRSDVLKGIPKCQ
jgi:hypothetical protein